MKLAIRRSTGFTIIEFVLIIVVLAIVAGLIVLAASGVQSKNRNGERQREIDSLRAQLESYYAQTDTYPAFDNLKDAQWRAKNLPRLKPGDIADPHWSKTNAACTTDNAATIASQPTPNCYSYQVTAAGGNPCDNAAAPCAHYSLTVLIEGGKTYAKTSLN